MEEDRIRGLMRVVETAVRERYGRHDQIEEVLSAAYVGMWQSLVANEENPRCKPETAARNGGLWAAGEWMRSRENDRRVHTRRGHPVPPLYSLDVLESQDEVLGEQATSESGQPLFEMSALAPFSPDHAEAVAAELTRAQWVERMIGAGIISQEDWLIVRRTVIEGDKPRDVAKELGVSYDGLLRRRRLILVRLRAAAGEWLSGEEA